MPPETLSWLRFTLLVGLVWLGSCREATESRSSVLLVLTDTVRADKLGCYGNERGLTPNLDAFAARGLRFSRASSHAPWTLPATATILTGLYPAEHGAGGRLGDFQGLRGDVTTLPAVFNGAGYDTHCIANVGFLDSAFGVTRDFQTTDIVAPKSNVEMRDARRTTDAALAWLESHGERPFFLLVHYFDAHAVYNPPLPFRERFAREPDRRDGSWLFPTRAQMVALRSGAPLPPRETLERAEALYDGEVAYLDQELGRLLEGLEQRGLAEETAVVITSDHGEEFLDHGGFEHGHQLYQELLHVPLLLSARGVKPAVVERVVGQVDLARTLCRLAGLTPPAQFTRFGHDLLDTELPSRPILAQGNMWGEPLLALRMGSEKLIRREDGSLELYDLGVDPGEQSDLAALRPERVVALEGLLGEVQRYCEAHAAGRDLELPAELLRHLRSAGYAGEEER